MACSGRGLISNSRAEENVFFFALTCGDRLDRCYRPHRHPTTGCESLQRNRFRGPVVKTPRCGCTSQLSDETRVRFTAEPAQKLEPLGVLNFCRRGECDSIFFAQGRGRHEAIAKDRQRYAVCHGTRSRDNITPKTEKTCLLQDTGEHHNRHCERTTDSVTAGNPQCSRSLPNRPQHRTRLRESDDDGDVAHLVERALRILGIRSLERL
jgi:hypothetical protein